MDKTGKLGKGPPPIEQKIPEREFRSAEPEVYSARSDYDSDATETARSQTTQLSVPWPEQLAAGQAEIIRAIAEHVGPGKDLRNFSMATKEFRKVAIERTLKPEKFAKLSDEGKKNILHAVIRDNPDFFTNNSYGQLISWVKSAGSDLNEIDWRGVRNIPEGIYKNRSAYGIKLNGVDVSRMGLEEATDLRGIDWSGAIAINIPQRLREAIRIFKWLRWSE